MPKKKLPQTIEECNAELERTQKQLQQYENRNKILNRKLSAEKRKERNHCIFLYGGFMESIMPELKAMTEDEGKDFLYHIAKSTEAQEYLKKRAEEVKRIIPLVTRAHLYTLAGVVRSAEGLWAHGSSHAPTLAACAAQGKLHFPCDSLRCPPFCVPTKQDTLLRQAVPFHGAESRRSEVNRYRNLSLQHQDHQPGEWQVSRCRCCLPKRRENHKRMGRHDP